ncbi:MAG: hypothetical protein ACI4EF_03745 [Coprococcus sp.]
MIPTSVADRSILGFSNTAGDSIVCFWNDKSVTYFTSRIIVKKKYMIYICNVTECFMIYGKMIGKWIQIKEYL